MLVARDPPLIYDTKKDPASQNGPPPASIRRRSSNAIDRSF